MVLPADIDSDGDLADLTAIYSKRAATTISLAGATTGDIWVGGAISTFSITSGLYHGDLTAKGNVGTISLAGDFVSNMNILGSLSSMTVTGANFKGTLDVTGNVSKLSVLAKTNKSTGTSVGGTFAAGANVTVGGKLTTLTVSKHDTNNGGAEFGVYSHTFSSHHPGHPEADHRQPALRGRRLLRGDCVGRAAGGSGQTSRGSAEFVRRTA